MSSIAARMRVAREFKKEFDDRFKAGIKDLPTSESAGRMARFLFGIKVLKANYTGRATQEKLLVAYLRRAIKIQWNESDLRCVCEFLDQLPREGWLRSEFLDIGVEQFPRTPHFHFWAGARDVHHGSMFCDFGRAIARLEKAIDLHNTGGLKLNDGELEEARSALSMIKDVQERERTFAGGSPFYLGDDDDDEDESFYEDEEVVHDSLPQIDEATIAELESTMPPHIRKTLEETARNMGLSPGEVFHKMMSIFGRPDVEADDDPRGRRAGHERK